MFKLIAKMSKLFSVLLMLEFLSLNLNQWIVTYPAYLTLIISEVQLKKEEYLSINTNN